MMEGRRDDEKEERGVRTMSALFQAVYLDRDLWARGM
jgi:hypothetical protein